MLQRSTPRVTHTIHRPVLDLASSDASRDFITAQLFIVQQQARQRLNLLSRRELEVIRHVVNGLPNKTIATELNISHKTVEKHRSHAMSKLECCTLADLMKLWFQAYPAELCDIRSCPHSTD